MATGGGAGAEGAGVNAATVFICDCENISGATDWASGGIGIVGATAAMRVGESSCWGALTLWIGAGAWIGTALLMAATAWTGAALLAATDAFVCGAIGACATCVGVCTGMARASLVVSVL